MNQSQFLTFSSWLDISLVCHTCATCHPHQWQFLVGTGEGEVELNIDFGLTHSLCCLRLSHIGNEVSVCVYERVWRNVICLSRMFVSSEKETEWERLRLLLFLALEKTDDFTANASLGSQKVGRELTLQSWIQALGRSIPLMGIFDSFCPSIY